MRNISEELHGIGRVLPEYYIAGNIRDYLAAAEAKKIKLTEKMFPPALFFHGTALIEFNNAKYEHSEGWSPDVTGRLYDSTDSIDVIVSADFSLSGFLPKRIISEGILQIPYPELSDGLLLARALVLYPPRKEDGRLRMFYYSAVSRKITPAMLIRT